MKKIEDSEWLSRFYSVHNNLFDYARSEFKGADVKIAIGCFRHGIFWQAPRVHARGVGCPECAYAKLRSEENTLRDCTAAHIAKSKEKYGDSLDYSKTVYTGSHEDTIYICKKHGEFKQKAYVHVHARSKFPCPDCAKAAIGARCRLSTEEFVSRSLDRYTPAYSYQKTEYKGQSRKVIVTCREHGDFYPNAGNHIRGVAGCPKCASRKTGERCRDTKESFLVKAKIAWPDANYSFSNTIYVNSTTPIVVTCEKHGDFNVYPSDFLSGHGCQKCGRESCPGAPTRSFESVIEEAERVHAGKWAYSSAGYSGVRGNLTCYCEQHGEFKQKASNHLNGNGCPKCKASKPEIELYEYINNKVPNVLHRDRKVLNGLELDVFLPDYAIGFEMNGVYWHSDKSPRAKDAAGWVKWHQLEKLEAANRAGIRLIQYYDDEWNYRQGSLTRQIDSILGFSTKIPARELKAKKIDWVEAREFLEQNHLQGAGMPGKAYGLFKERTLCALAVFGKPLATRSSGPTPGEFELLRFSSNCTVVGGLSKLIAAFRRDEHTCNTLISFSDRRFSVGGVYQKLGFSMEKQTPPGYCYVLGGKRIHRAQFRRDRLEGRLGETYDPTISEAENCKKAGIARLYDCGMTKWRKEF